MNAKKLFNLHYAQVQNIIECIFGVLKQRFWILLLPPCYPLDFQLHIPVALCVLQNFIQKINKNEGAIPNDPFQAAHTYFSDISDDHDSGFIADEEEEGNSEVKSQRMNIVNKMWKSYLNYTVNAVDSDDNL